MNSFKLCDTLRRAWRSNSDQPFLMFLRNTLEVDFHTEDNALINMAEHYIARPDNENQLDFIQLQKALDRFVVDQSFIEFLDKAISYTTWSSNKMSIQEILTLVFKTYDDTGYIDTHSNYDLGLLD